MSENKSEKAVALLFANSGSALRSARAVLGEEGCKGLVAANGKDIIYLIMASFWEKSQKIIIALGKTKEEEKTAQSVFDYLWLSSAIEDKEVLGWKKFESEQERMIWILMHARVEVEDGRCFFGSAQGLSEGEKSRMRISFESDEVTFGYRYVDIDKEKYESTLNRWCLERVLPPYEDSWSDSLRIIKEKEDLVSVTREGIKRLAKQI